MCDKKSFFNLMSYYSVIKRSELLIHDITIDSLKKLTNGKKSDREDLDCMILFV